MAQGIARWRAAGPMLAMAAALVWPLRAVAQTADDGGEIATPEMIVGPAEAAGAVDEGGTSVRQRWGSPFDVLSRGSVSPREPRTVVVRQATPEAIAAVAEPGQVVARVQQMPGTAPSALMPPEPPVSETAVAGAPESPDAALPDVEEAAAASPAAGEGAAASGVRRHTVITGDTLFGLARRFGVSPAAIREANRMTDDVVRLGQTLVIPGQEATR